MTRPCLMPDPSLTMVQISPLQALLLEWQEGGLRINVPTIGWGPAKGWPSPMPVTTLQHGVGCLRHTLIQQVHSTHCQPCLAHVGWGQVVLPTSQNRHHSQLDTSSIVSGLFYTLQCFKIYTSKGLSWYSFRILITLSTHPLLFSLHLQLWSPLLRTSSLPKSNFWHFYISIYTSSSSQSGQLNSQLLKC